MARRAAGAHAHAIAPLSAALAALIAPAAHGQSASQLAPEILAPRPPGVQFAPMPSTAPVTPGARDPHEETVDLGAPISPAQIVLENAPPGEEEACRRIIVDATAGPLTIGAIRDAARRVQTHLGDRGFVLARVVVLTDSGEHPVLRIHVVDGFIERLDLDNLPPGFRRRASELLTGLQRRTWLRESHLRRQLDLLNQVPGAAVTAALVKGAETGGAVLVVSGNSKTVQSWAGLDNRVGESLGGMQEIAGVALSNLAGRGDRVLLQASGNFGNGYWGRRPMHRALAADASVGIGAQGLSAFASFVDVASEPRTPPGGLPVASKFERLTLGMRYPLVLASRGSLVANLQIDAATDQTQVARERGFGLSMDRTRVARLGLDARARHVDGVGAVQASLRHSVGIDGLGARAARDATVLLPLSRQKATAAFSKTEVDIATATTFGDAGRWRLTTHAAAQTSYREALLRSEQAGLATSDLLSPFESGAVVGDSTLAARTDLHRDFATRWGGVAPYVFVAGGLAELHAPTILERRTTRATSFGAGARGQVAVRGGAVLDLRAELGVGRRTNGKDEPRLSAALTIAR